MSVEIVAFMDLDNAQQEQVAHGIAKQIGTSRPDIVLRCCVLANPWITVTKTANASGGTTSQLYLVRESLPALVLLLRSYVTR